MFHCPIHTYYKSTKKMFRQAFPSEKYFFFAHSFYVDISVLRSAPQTKKESLIF
jgi:hypothetical protein